MSTHAHPARPWRAADLRWPRWLQPLVRHWRRMRRAAATRRELARLDDTMLRDLGLRRSEIGSISAELAGLAETTRLRAQRP